MALSRGAVALNAASLCPHLQSDPHVLSGAPQPSARTSHATSAPATVELGLRTTFQNRNKLTPDFVAAYGTPEEIGGCLVDTHAFGQRDATTEGPWATRAALQTFKTMYEAHHGKGTYNSLPHLVQYVRQCALVVLQTYAQPMRYFPVRSMRAVFDAWHKFHAARRAIADASGSSGTVLPKQPKPFPGPSPFDTSGCPLPLHDYLLLWLRA